MERALPGGMLAYLVFRSRYKGQPYNVIIAKDFSDEVQMKLLATIYSIANENKEDEVFLSARDNPDEPNLFFFTTVLRHLNTGGNDREDEIVRLAFENIRQRVMDHPIEINSRHTLKISLSGHLVILRNTAPAIALAA